MKKSERTKIKLKTIEILKSRLSRSRRILAKNLAAARSDSKLKNGYRTAAKGDLYEIHSDLFLLRAAEKQMPMPVRINTRINKFPFWLHNGQRILNIDYEAHCPNCNRFIESGTKYPNLFWRYFKKYCPHCGQKLLWSGN